MSFWNLRSCTKAAYRPVALMLYAIDWFQLAFEVAHRSTRAAGVVVHRNGECGSTGRDGLAAPDAALGSCQALCSPSSPGRSFTPALRRRITGGSTDTRVGPRHRLCKKSLPPDPRRAGRPELSVTPAFQVSDGVRSGVRRSRRKGELPKHDDAINGSILWHGVSILIALQ